MIEINIKHYDEEFIPTEIINRRAVRAIAINGGKLLMIKSNKNGDYKFPGGGIEAEETEEEALIREVKEESGYEIRNIGDLVFSVFEESQDKYDSSVLFRMNSKYYLCDVGNIQAELQLDSYEEELGFEPIWIETQEALEMNNEVVKSGIIIKWITRENRILNEIIKGNLYQLY